MKYFIEGEGQGTCVYVLVCVCDIYSPPYKKCVLISLIF